MKYIFWQKIRQHLIRLLLLLSVVFSLIIPFVKMDLNQIIGQEKNVFFSILSFDQTAIPNALVNGQGDTPIKEITIGFMDVIFFIQMVVFLLFLLFFLYQIVKLIIIYHSSEKLIINDTTIAVNKRFDFYFSFLHFIFIPESQKNNKNLSHIIAHELIHVRQWHSMDNLLFGLVKCFFWFHPIMWIYSKKIKEIHEYIVDEQLIKQGIDKACYKRLLIAESISDKGLQKLISSSFASNINNRIMTIDQPSKLKLNYLSYLSLSMLLVIMVVLSSCVNSRKGNDTLVAIAPQKLKTLYIGVDNPIEIAAYGIKSKDLSIRVDGNEGAEVSGSEGKYNISVTEPGKATIIVMKKNRIVDKQEFLVKRIPDPMITTNIEFLKEEDVYKNKHYRMTKDALIDLKGIYTESLDSPLSPEYRIKSYRIVLVPVDNDPKVAYAYAGEFPQFIIDLIKEAEPEDKIYVEDLMAINTAGKEMALSPLCITIKE